MVSRSYLHIPKLMVVLAILSGVGAFRMAGRHSCRRGSSRALLTVAGLLHRAVDRILIDAATRCIPAGSHSGADPLRVALLIETALELLALRLGEGSDAWRMSSTVGADIAVLYHNRPPVGAASALCCRSVLLGETALQTKRGSTTPTK